MKRFATSELNFALDNLNYTQKQAELHVIVLGMAKHVVLNDVVCTWLVSGFNKRRIQFRMERTDPYFWN